jgi:hypothetical protein
VKVAKYNTWCIAGLISSIVSLLLGFTLIIDVFIIFVCIIGINQVDRKNENGKGVAFIGILIAVLSMMM